MKLKKDGRLHNKENKTVIQQMVESTECVSSLACSPHTKFPIIEEITGAGVKMFFKLDARVHYLSCPLVYRLSVVNYILIIIQHILFPEFTT